MSLRPSLSSLTVSFALLASAIGAQAAAEAQLAAPLVIQAQGSFAVGGRVIRAAEPHGQTLHGDHAYVFYQIPANARPLPLVMWHGFGQSGKTWETTPDGREGFQTLFLRRQFAVYLLDQPRRGRAAKSTVAANLTATPDEAHWFSIFRLGQWPKLYPNIQFSRDPEALNQFFRQSLPDTGPIDLSLNVAAVSALFDRIGPGILVTHSHSGGMGWATAVKNKNVRAIVAFEPGSNFAFPEGELPPAVPHVEGQLSGIEIPLSDFIALTRIPILIYYGDMIAEAPSTDSGQDYWRAALALARQWQATVNAHGGDVTLVPLPEIGLHGNTHFPMSDLNNVEVAAHMAAFLEAKGLSQ